MNKNLLDKLKDNTQEAQEALEARNNILILNIFRTFLDLIDDEGFRTGLRSFYPFNGAIKLNGGKKPIEFFRGGFNINFEYTDINELNEETKRKAEKFNEALAEWENAPKTLDTVSYYQSVNKL